MIGAHPHSIVLCSLDESCRCAGKRGEVYGQAAAGTPLSHRGQLAAERGLQAGLAAVSQPDGSQREQGADGVSGSCGAIP